MEQDLRGLPISYDEEASGRKISFLTSKYGSIDRIFDICISLQQFLGLLNKAIDQANAGVRPFIDDAEAYKAQQATVSRMLSRIQNEEASVSKEFNTVTGVWDVTELKQSFSPQMVEKFRALDKSLKRQIMECEATISQLNGKSIFSLDIEDDVYDFIYDI